MVNTPDIRERITEDAERHGLLIPLERVHQWVLPARTASLFAHLKSTLALNVADKHDFEEWLFPRLVPEVVLARTGWLDGSRRQEAFAVCPKRDVTYAREQLVPADESLFEAAGSYPPAEILYSLDPIQCVCFYYALHHRILDSNALPLKVFEHQGGWTWRNELETIGFFKTVEFQRVEFVWLGTCEQTVDTRSSLLDSLRHLLVNDLGLDVQFVEGDSCFLEPSKELEPEATCYDHAEDVRELPTVDLVVRMSDDTICEICSASRYDHLTERFGIASDLDDEELWSGCLGIGLNRLLVCLWDKHGFDEESWGDSVRSALGF